MKQDKHQARIGANKLLTYTPDPFRETDQEFLREFQQAAAMPSSSVQEFLLRLADIQKQSDNHNTNHMNIELKNIKTYEKLSQETTAFSANIYINGVNAGESNNTGDGGPTSYGHNGSAKTKKLIEQAEAWCQKLPAEILRDTPSKGKTVTIQMNMENYIDNLVDAHLRKKDLEKFHKNMIKHQHDSIIFGIPDQQYQRLKFAKPIAEIVNNPKGVEALHKAVQEKILPLLKEGEKILNTNLPDHLMNLERKRPAKELVQQKIPLGKELKHNR